MTRSAVPTRASAGGAVEGSESPATTWSLSARPGPAGMGAMEGDRGGVRVGKPKGSVDQRYVWG